MYVHIFLDALCLPIPWMHTEWCDKGSKRAFPHIRSPLGPSVDMRAKEVGRFPSPSSGDFPCAYGRMKNLSNIC